MAKKLTDISIKKIKSDPAKRLEIPDAGKPGLYLVIQPSGKKSWAVRYRFNGKPRKLTLKGFPSIAAAHKLAQEALDKVAAGKDPASEKEAPPPRVDLFKDVAADFIKRHVKENTSRTYARDVERRFRKDVLDRLGDKDIRAITKLDINKLLDAVADRGGGLSANTIHAMLRSLFIWSIGKGYLDASPMVYVKRPLKVSARDRVLAEDEISSLWRACEVVGYPYGTLAQLLLLTGQRRSEVSGMRWDEIDLGKKVWLIPGERTKNGEPHEVPLSEPVLVILKSLPNIKGRYVLTHSGDYPVTNHGLAKHAIDDAMAAVPRWTLHDLRRTAATGMARLHIPLQVAENVLNHISGSLGGMAGIYNRHDYADEKRSALEAWGRYVLALQRPAENVVALRAV
jgi:integrase